MTAFWPIPRLRAVLARQFWPELLSGKAARCGVDFLKQRDQPVERSRGKLVADRAPVGSSRRRQLDVQTERHPACAQAAG